MAIIAKFTRTLPAPTATISGGFVFLLSAGWFTQANTGAAGSPIDGGTNSIANGGGDMQIFSDTAATTQLPIEVVTFVTGGSPQCQVWVRTPSYTAGDTITIGKDDTQTTQPAVGAAFGRNATWVDYSFVSHDGGLTDSSLGLMMVDDGSGAVTVDQAGNAALTTPKQRLFDATVADLTTDFCIQLWHNGTNNGHMQTRSDTSIQWQVSILSGSYFVNTTGDTGNTAIQTVPSGWNYLSVNFKTPSDIEHYLNTLAVVNVNRVSISSQSTIPARVGYRGAGGPPTIGFPYGGIIGNSRITKTAITSQKHLSERLNQVDPDNFGTSSEYILVGGSGTSITATLGTIEYNSNDTVIGLAGNIDITATLGSINYSSNDTSIQVSGDVSVIATLGTISYASNDAAISLFGNIDVTATLGTIDYNSNDANISLLGGINVNATLGAIDYTSNNTAITLQGQTALTTTLGAISYDSNSVIVQVGTGQVIGNVTAGFADKLYSAGFKPSEITVNFKT